MIVKDFADKLNMRVLAGFEAIEREITGIYTGDLLSWVMSHASKGNAWITVLTNLNVVAVAVLTEVACIIIPEGISVEEATLKKAGQEGIVILSTEMSAYEICCKAGKLMDN